MITLSGSPLVFVVNYKKYVQRGPSRSVYCGTHVEKLAAIDPGVEPSFVRLLGDGHGHLLCIVGSSESARNSG
jgi:hypothetical protein